MTEVISRISDLHRLTNEIYKIAASLDSNMEHNNAEDLEALPVLFAKRQEAIEELDRSMKEPGFEWAAEEREMAVELAALDQQLQPMLNGLHQAFKMQMERINQTKQLSVKYKNSYQNASVDGTFFDARK